MLKMKTVIPIIAITSKLIMLANNTTEQYKKVGTILWTGIIFSICSTITFLCLHILRLKIIFLTATN